jgi:hypothetical protein
MENKICQSCGLKFYRPEKYPAYRWVKRRFCSKSCASIVSNTGRKATDEARRNMSLAHLGQVISEETRRKIGLASKGNTNTKGKKIHTEEHKEVLRKKWLGNQIVKGLKFKNRKRYEHTEEHRINESLGQFRRISEGKHNFYIDGRSKFEDRLRGTPEWRFWREAVFKRDNFTCRWCGEKGCYLEPHHIKKRSNYPKLVFKVTNGITLCRPCHNKTKGKEYKFEGFFTQILNQR